ncbi:MAG: stage V sporulation protein AA [Lachnospiraceae bacterium]
MASNIDTIYIKADRNVEITKPEVTLGDVISIECSNRAIVSRVKTLKLYKFHHTDNKNQNRVAVSILKVIACIHEIYPNADIQSVGEQDFIVTYEQQKSPNKFFHCLKVTAVVLITFCGAAFSIMAFNNDVNVTKLFGQIYELVTGTKSDGYTVLEFTYCVGIIIGILTFFNHFGKKKFTVDPTPMEVEMRLYENDIQTTLIEDNARKEKELDVWKSDHTGNSRV